MIAERFFSKTKLADHVRPGMTTPCLEWTASCNRKGYGHCSRAGKIEQAHRVAWEMANGPIPDGLHVLHKCDNPPCVDDEHLFLGTDADNAADRDAKGRHRASRGDANGARLHPERMPRCFGDANGARLHPECLARGERAAGAKLTESKVRIIFTLRAQGWTHLRIAGEFGVCQQQISRILAHRRWAHVDAEAIQ